MDIEILKWLQLAQTVLLFILPALVVAFVATRKTHERPFQWLHMDKGMPWQVAAYAVVAILVAAPGINLLASWNEMITLPAAWSGMEEWMKKMEESSAELTEAFLRANGIGTLLVNIGLMAVLPAFSEELFFRGMLQRSRRAWCIWLVAALFSAIHLQFYGFIPRMLLGAWFGYMLVWTGSLWVPMLMHFVNNLAAVLTYYYIYAHGMKVEDMENWGAGDTWPVGVLSLILTGAGIYAIRRYSRTRRY